MYASKEQMQEWHIQYQNALHQEDWQREEAYLASRENWQGLDFQRRVDEYVYENPAACQDDVLWNRHIYEWMHALAVSYASVCMFELVYSPVLNVLRFTATQKREHQTLCFTAGSLTELREKIEANQFTLSY